MKGKVKSAPPPFDCCEVCVAMSLHISTAVRYDHIFQATTIDKNVYHFIFCFIVYFVVPQTVVWAVYWDSATVVPNDRLLGTAMAVCDK